MSTKPMRRFFLLGTGIFLLIFTMLINVNAISSANKPSQLSDVSVDQSIFLPIVIRPISLPFGVQTSWIDPNLLSKAKGIQTRWWRISEFSWKKIEPTYSIPRQYDWTKVNEIALQAVAQSGSKIIGTVQYTPGWAQKYPPYSCGPIAQNQFDEFAAFMQALVLRYGNPPYNIKYWEIGNEIDVDHILVIPDNIFGCWGEETDRYYGGGYYAEMLKVVYPAIKAVDPAAQIIIGSLLLDCDPTYPPPVGKPNCLPSKFFEGILRRNGNLDGGNYFDIVGYHSYGVYNQVNGIIDEDFDGWEERGGVFLGKVDFIREIMANYNVEKAIMNTEISLLCPEYFVNSCNPPSNAFFEAQADYATWTVVRSIAAGLESYIWYTLNGEGWRFGGLLNENQQPNPVYNSMVFVTQKLARAFYIGELTQQEFSGLRAFEFSLDGNRLWVLWSPDQIDHPFTLPLETIQVLDKYGNIVMPNQGQITVNSPIYIELQP